MSQSNGSSSKATLDTANEEILIDRVKKMSLPSDPPSKPATHVANQETLIIFDLDNTLSDHDYSLRYVLYL